MSPFSQLAYWKSFFHGDDYSQDQIPTLSGKVAIVTGANSGIGFATTAALAARGARVFLACRSRGRAEKAINRAKEEIKAKYSHTPTPQLEFLELDMNDMNKARQAAQEFLKKRLPLYILVNNSGGALELNADGVENEFAVNHMGHFVLTMALLDRIRDSRPSRIVIMTTSLHENTPGINYDTIFKSGDSSQSYHQCAWDRFYRSKLANIMFAKALARRLGNESRVS
ncbi:hypothetical protein BG015_009411 [Linnemannia schmuckeri]|uniref:Uncharacterized protein n=1 Tax=Linnemannia schmuckeri TaxID=64567 RepID=A0A9P5RY15_9FUNG|nr:hypothetical protein BG015_009411 [Linnemannia schmuckeri]